MIKIFFIIVLLFTGFVLPQTNQLKQVGDKAGWVKWEKADTRYEKPSEFRHREYSFDTENVSGFIAKSTANAYWYFISDLDGDNCPYRPSCSSFFVQASKETNIVQGTLMFFDRFTRDFNIYKRHEHYPRVKDGHYYDPVSLYTLDENQIDYIPPSVTVTK
ncbi:MAG: membrane protein insertion efficiency factor YidD [Bacteroidetes bacterium]|nr:membrane protein insertion efficiency factor YidD [Bacteroidota bacterium]